MILCNLVILALFILPSIATASYDLEIEGVLKQAAKKGNLREVFDKARNKPLFDRAHKLLFSKEAETSLLKRLEMVDDPSPGNIFSIPPRLDRVFGIYAINHDFSFITQGLLALPTKAAKAIICMRFNVLKHGDVKNIFDLVTVFRPEILLDNIPIWLTSNVFNDFWWSMEVLKRQLDIAFNALLPLVSLNDLEETLDILNRADEEFLSNPQNPALKLFARHGDSPVYCAKIEAALNDLKKALNTSAKETLDGMLPSVLVTLTLEYL